MHSPSKMKNKLGLFLLLFLCSCAAPKTIDQKIGQVWHDEGVVFKAMNFGPSTRYLIMDNSDIEYVWKYNANGIIYRKSRYMNKEEIVDELISEGVSIETLDFKPIQNQLIKKFLKMYTINDAFGVKAKDMMVYGQLRGENWRVTWEKRDYENSLVDSVFNKEIMEDTILVHITLKDSLLHFDNWRFEKDSYDNLPLRLSQELITRTEDIENENGELIGMKSLTSWRQGKVYIKELTQVLGEPSLIIGSEIPSTYYFWEWKNGLIMISLDTLLLKNQDGYKTAAQYVFISGLVENDEFILAP